MLFNIINLFNLRKEKGKTSYLFWGVLFLTSSMLIEFLSLSNTFTYLSLLLKLSAYLIFFVYFYNGIYGKIMEQVIEADKKLNTYNKSLNLEIKKRVFEIEKSNQKLVSISKTDPLTKALNKKAIMDAMEELVLSKPNSIFSIIMFDIDNFKTVNDVMGHIIGDKCIQKVASIGSSCIRDMDSLGRYGGDEFIVLLPGSTSIQAKVIAERFRKRVEETEQPHFTVSIGISTFPADGTNVKDLIGAADEGLYISKKKGKNIVSHKNIY
jgi:diguanylate cyclase (GGDEF)-like protein